jgi:hypothetical protein
MRTWLRFLRTSFMSLGVAFMARRGDLAGMGGAAG